jgi:hypothetical protein
LKRLAPGLTNTDIPGKLVGKGRFIKVQSLIYHIDLLLLLVMYMFLDGVHDIPGPWLRKEASYRGNRMGL